MPVLYVGHYRESSGWGQVTRDQILALDAAGVEVVTRCIPLGLAWAEVPQRILDLEQGDTTKCDVIIQHVLPHYMKYDNHFRKNIGMFELETTNIQHTSWIDHLNLMDELWVPCTSMMDLKGVKPNCKYVPHACDPTEYDLRNTCDKLEIPELNGRFTFYSVGTLSRRKRWPALIRAFHTEFHWSEPVSLLLKVNKTNIPPEQVVQETIEMCKSIKEGLNLYEDTNRYIPENILPVDLSREQLLQLHYTCDCFVTPSFGEAWCAPAFDALGMGRYVIASNFGGPSDYITDGQNGFLVDGRMTTYFGKQENFPTIGTARELEFDISVLDLQAKMRHVYELGSKGNIIKTQAERTPSRYSYENIGKLMKGLLDV